MIFSNLQRFFYKLFHGKYLSEGFLLTTANHTYRNV
jgi:hypothetical protein